MAETSVHGDIHRESSGDSPNRRSQPPPPLSPSDLIGALPNDVIHHIFSFLPLQDVVKTSVLSKRWQSTWTTTTHFVFNGDRPRNHETYSFDFLSLVNSVLIQSTSPTVKRLHVTGFVYDEANSPKLDFCLRFAMARRVEDLCLGLTASPFLYTLPRFASRLTCLVRLEVSYCCFSLGTSIRWPCLKVLSIRHRELCDHSLQKILRGSPVLESLELDSCKGVKNIRIDSTSVKDLLLVPSLFSNAENLWAPHLLSLRVSGFSPHDSVFRLDDVSSLVEANLYLRILYFSMSHVERIRDLLKGLLEKLRGVPTLATGGSCLQILSYWEMEGVHSPLSKCRNLTLNAPVSRWDLPGIVHLLRSSPCLEKLVIRLAGFTNLQFELDEESKDRFNYDEEDFLCARKGNFECLAKHLKRVEIIGFQANSFRSKYLLALMKFLLGDALVLEKLIIKAELPSQYGQERHQDPVLSELLGVMQEVLSYRRASRNAEVIFNHPFKETSF
ncbi:F-box protein At5g03100-like [Rhodamnia argentea]|uniref:F-box protein At5g03100-like n=1 Tax=Rhodamnia argentea TaxID=178133 RepID=A0ABM3H765_9MYRT|nr:F-box protein At5g03100-like [Rhodamnia argentea]